MPNITVPNREEKQLLKELGMGIKDYGVINRSERMFGLLCYATRDYIWVKINPPTAGEEAARPPDDLEKQILQENGIQPEYFDVTFRAADIIQLRFRDTEIYVEIWKGDRKW